MIYHIAALPREQDLKLLNKIRDYVYKNGFRFSDKPLGSDTHITLTEVNLDESDSEVDKLYQYLQSNISSIKAFSLNNSEWKLTKKLQSPNYKIDKPYTWIALKFSQRAEIYNVLDRLTKEFNVNNNREYIENVKKIEGNISDSECIANHINLSNYTKVEKADECWEYFNNKLPQMVFFDKIILRNVKGEEIFRLNLTR